MSLVPGKQIASAPLGIDSTNLNTGAVTSTKLGALAVGTAALGSIAGNGLTGGSGSALAVQAGDTSISVSGAGVVVAFAANAGLVTSSGVKINLAASSGLQLSTNQLTVLPNPTNATLSVTASGLAVKPDTNGGLIANAGGLGIKLPASSGLQVGASGLSVLPNPTNATIAVAAAGISVIVDPAGAILAGTSGLKVNPGSGIVVSANAVTYDATVLLDKTTAQTGISGAKTFTGGITVTTLPITATAGVTGLPAPVNPTDATNKAYVDAALQGLSIHPAVRVATTVVLAANTYVNRFELAVVSLTGLNPGDSVNDGLGNTGTIYAISGSEVQITVTAGTWSLTGALNDTTTVNSTTYTNGVYGPGSTLTANVNGSINSPGIDGVTNLAVNDRALVNNEVAQSHNGIFFVSQVGDGSHPYILTRSDDFDETTGSHPDFAAGAFTFVTEGLTNASSGWVLATTGAIVVGTTALSFTQFSGAGEIIANNGLTKTGNTLDVVPGDTSLTATPGSLIVRLNTNGGLVTSTGLKINLPASSGLQLSSNQLSVLPNPTNATIAVAAAGISVIVDPAGAVVAGASGLKVQVGNGISITGNTLLANLDGTSLAFSGATIAINYSATTPSQFANAAATGSDVHAARIDHIHKRDTDQQDYFAVGSPVLQGTSSNYTLSATPVQNLAVRFYLNGLFLEQGGGADYTISGVTVTYLGGNALATTDKFEAVYASL